VPIIVAQFTMLASIALACSFLVTPQARAGLRPVGLRMCEEPELPGTPATEEPAAMSLITELAENRMAGMSKWDEMSKAFAAAAGCEWEAAEALGAQKDWETAEIDLEQFTALLASKGDGDLGDAKIKSMFDAVDTNGDGKIAFVKYYQACNDEAIARRPNPFAGLFGGKK